MNIFVLDLDPEAAAKYHCDLHVCKMVIESAQMLCGVFPDGTAPYKRSYYHHPCSKWTRASQENYEWHAWLAINLAGEYQQRYGRRHKCADIIEWCVERIDQLELPQIGLTPFAQAMPDQYKDPDPVKAYRAYYLGEKKGFAKWMNGRGAPTWYVKNTVCTNTELKLPELSTEIQLTLKSISASTPK